MIDAFGKAMGVAIGEVFVKGIIVAVMLILILAMLSAAYGIFEVVFGNRKLGTALLLLFAVSIVISRTVHQPWPLLLYFLLSLIVAAARLIHKVFS